MSSLLFQSTNKVFLIARLMKVLSNCFLNEGLLGKSSSIINSILTLTFTLFKKYFIDTALCHWEQLCYNLLYPLSQPGISLIIRLAPSKRGIVISYKNRLGSL